MTTPNLSDSELAEILGTEAAPAAPAPTPAPAATKPAGSPIKAYIDPAALSKDVSISAASLEEELINHSALLAYYGNMAVNARRQRDKVKTTFEITEAKISEELRAKYAAEGTKLTEARLEQLIRLDPRYATLRQLLDDANAEMERGVIAVETFKQRNSMLIQLSAGERVERAGANASNLSARADSAMSAIRQGTASAA